MTTALLAESPRPLLAAVGRVAFDEDAGIGFAGGRPQPAGSPAPHPTLDELVRGLWRQLQQEDASARCPVCGQGTMRPSHGVAGVAPRIHAVCDACATALS